MTFVHALAWIARLTGDGAAACLLHLRFVLAEVAKGGGHVAVVVVLLVCGVVLIAVVCAGS